MWRERFGSTSFRMHLLTILLAVATTALVELLMGRVPIFKGGYVSLWYPYANGPGNSQHLSDWYTPSHVIHGFLFYWFLWMAARRLPLRTRMLLAVLIECGWEILENSPLIINRYRTATMALDYFGDSIVNSVSDVIFMTFGFLLAMRCPVWLTVVLAVAMELLAALVIRDNLTLNTVMLIFPVDAIKAWQTALPSAPPM